MQLSINEALCALKEDALTRQFIMPLVECLHPGRLEFTHSPTEAGRDIVSFGKDCLGRDHILCVQVKATPMSFGAAFGKVQQTLILAKTIGVVLENGAKCFPNEVWLVSSHPFPEQKRRQVADALQEMERNNTKVVSGEELSRLLIDHLPKEIAALQKADSPKTVQLISELYVHTESRAFGLPHDRTLDQFYVTATLAIDCELAYRALAGAVLVFDQKVSLGGRPKEILREKKKRKLEAVAGAAPDGSLSQQKVKEILLRQSPYHSACRSLRIAHEMKGKYPEKRWAKMVNDNEYISFTLALSLRKSLKALVKATIEQMDSCPNELNGNATTVTKMWSRLRHLDEALTYAREQFPNSIEFISDDVAAPVRLRLTCLRDVCNLEHTVLVEGPPGSGKTTLLRMLGIDLLSRGENALYLPCYRIESSMRTMQLSKLLKKYAFGADCLDWSPRETHILIDGLDEAPFDLSSLIARQSSEFKSVVISGRSAYVRRMQRHFLSLSVEPFTVEERDAFFEKWFSQRQDLLKTTTNLVVTYPDIGLHARLPLIATMLVALVENGYTPRSRAEIYNHRLDLLLSRWDRSRGVARTFVDNPDAKRRFLRYLAFSMHNSPRRRRTIRQTELHSVFEASLGMWGYSVDIEKVIDDLVLAHGILLEESPNTYSFGHLTFQEHLAGEHISKEYRIRDILDLLGKDWWREPLNFYASITGNIDELVKAGQEDEGYIADARQLLEMASYAPYTSPGAVETLREIVSHIEHSESDEYLDDSFS